MDFFISDTHFGHKNIIRFCERPYRTVSEMNEGMISNWNKTVTDADRVFVVGDVFIMDPVEASHIIKRLNGYKILIAGNHDRSQKTMLDCGFDEYHRKYEYEIDGIGTGLLLHYPMPDILIESMGYKFLVHGHIHDKPHRYGLKINVAADLLNFTPMSKNSLRSILSMKTFNSKSSTETFEAGVKDGILKTRMEIRMEDFSGAVDHIYSVMRNHWSEKKK